MRTVVCIEVEHDRPIPHLENLIAGRAWSIGGVVGAEVMRAEQPARVDLHRLERAGFSHAEIALGLSEVVRG